MAITKVTKQAVSRLKGQRRSLHEYTKRQIAEHEAAIVVLKAQEKALDVEIKALEKDIPEPDPEPV